LSSATENPEDKEHKVIATRSRIWMVRLLWGADVMESLKR